MPNFKNLEHNKFVCMPPDHDSHAEMRDECAEWEGFKLKDRGDGHYSIKDFHGKYLGADGEHIGHYDDKDNENCIFKFHFNQHDGYSRFNVEAHNGLFLWCDGHEIGFRAEVVDAWEQWAWMPNMHH